jgi:hypothetical protein
LRAVTTVEGGNVTKAGRVRGREGYLQLFEESEALGIELLPDMGLSLLELNHVIDHLGGREGGREGGRKGGRGRGREGGNGVGR